MIRDDGINVGIGIAPSARLHVNCIGRFDGGLTIDGRAAVSGDNYSHTARATADNRYGFFEVRNDSNTRGAYFGWGNGGDMVDLILEEDAIILHSTALKRRAAETIKANGYDHISLFLDTDGRAASNHLIKEVGPTSTTDLSKLYRDRNDWLMVDKSRWPVSDLIQTGYALDEPFTT